MSAPKMVTEREAVLRERAAYGAGLLRGSYQSFSRPSDLDAEAARFYPLPKIVRPRVVTDSDGDDWKIDNGVLLYRFCGEVEWHVAEGNAAIMAVTANPTEEVEDDGTESAGSPVSEAGR